jgi:hypothetical protein
MKMGIATGDMPDVEFIWSVQRSEGSRECFGQGKSCQERVCRWRAKCMALDFFAEISLASLAGWPKQQDKARRRSMREQSLDTAVEIDHFEERVPVQAGTLELVSGGSERS